MFLTFAGPAWAGGGDVVGNGGGQAELNADYTYENLERLYQPCLTGSPACGLTPDLALLLKNVRQALPQERLLGGLRFFSAPSPQNPCWKTEPQVGATLHINAVCLYGSPNKPIAFEQTAAFVLAGLLSHQTSAPAPQLLKWAQMVTQGLPSTVDSVTFWDTGVNLVVRSYRFHGAQALSSFLTAEDSLQSYDLSQLLLKKLNSVGGAVKIWNLEFPQKEGLNPPTVSFVVNWQGSEGSHWRGVVRIQLPGQLAAPANWKLAGDQVVMDLFEIEKL